MKFSVFREKVRKYPLFKSSMFAHLTEQPNFLRKQMTQWIEKGLVVELKRGVYTLSENPPISRWFIANQLYLPSYISLETALSYYGLIPEKVAVITSISSKKTQQFSNRYGVFHYYHLKIKAYSHFIMKKDEFGNSFFIAMPEKALLDFFYFKIRFIKKIDADIFYSSFRLQNLSIIDNQTLLSVAQLYSNKKLNTLVKLFIHAKDNFHD